MFTTKKRHLRRKRFFLLNQETFALFNAGNLKTSKITDIRLLLPKAKLYFLPLYLNPPKLARGYPPMMIIYNNLDDLKSSVTNLVDQLDCVGISIKHEWYSIDFFKHNRMNNLDNKILALLLLKKKEKLKPNKK